MDLLIKAEELKQLDGLLGEIPMKYGFPVVNFLNQVAQIRANEAAKAAQEAKKEISPDSNTNSGAVTTDSLTSEAQQN